MKKLTVLISFAICLFICVNVSAEALVYGGGGTVLVSYFSHETGHISYYQPAALATLQSSDDNNESYISDKQHTTVKSLAAEMRELLMDRETDAIIYYKTPYRISTTFYDELYNEIFRDLSDPRGGDYLLYTMEYYQITPGFNYDENGDFVYGLTLEMGYYTTAEEEAVANVGFTELANVFKSEHTDEYKMAHAIYTYICRNVTYDYVTLEDDDYKLKYTGYAALIKGTAVCQGYANMFYRLARECGLEARIVSGTSHDEPHAWNIVKLDGYYYNLDSTWDADDRWPYSSFKYFLKCDDEFTDHTPSEEFLTEEFIAAHPKYEKNYNPRNPAHRHEFISDVILESYATPVNDGITYRLCRCGEKGDITVTPFVDSATLYTDLDINDWSKTHIDFVSSNGFMGGTGNGKFEQTAHLTRAMFVTILWRIDGEPASVAKLPFTDIDAEQPWYHTAVAWAYENGIVNGTSENCFSPNGYITREQIVTILFRYCDPVNTEIKQNLDFPDIHSVSPFATDAVSWACESELITGKRDISGSLLIAPLAPITREETAIIICRYFEKIMKISF